MQELGKIHKGMIVVNREMRIMQLLLIVQGTKQKELLLKEMDIAMIHIVTLQIQLLILLAIKQ